MKRNYSLNGYFGLAGFILNNMKYRGFFNYFRDSNFMDEGRFHFHGYLVSWIYQSLHTFLYSICYSLDIEISGSQVTTEATKTGNQRIKVNPQYLLKLFLCVENVMTCVQLHKLNFVHFVDKSPLI